MNTGPRIWVGCLSCYTGGDLVGHWFDALDGDEITIGQVHAGHVVEEWSPHEELWVLDHDGFDGALKGECSPAEAARVAGFLAMLGDLSDDGRDAFAAYVDDDGTRGFDEETLKSFRDAYITTVEYAWHYAFELAQESGVDLQVWPYSCIDWRHAAREMDGVWFVETRHNKVHVFRNV